MAEILKPPAVSKGARVAVVAPASSAQHERIQRGVKALERRGYEVIVARHAYGKHPPYFAGTVKQRLTDLHDAFADTSIQAIFCIRGGYGSNYLLLDLDIDLIRAHPKPFFGYSDMTTMQMHLLDQTGLVAFHGPMVAADFYLEDGVNDASFNESLHGGLVEAGVGQGLRILKPGRARGMMYGGCLSILTAALGTPFAAQTEGKLLFLEDVGAKPYQIDRMLRHMVLAGKFDGVKGIIFGEMLNCVSPGANPDLIEYSILHALDWFQGPIAIGLRSGHVSQGNVTLPMGIEAELILEDEPVLRYLEPAVRI